MYKRFQRFFHKSSARSDEFFGKSVEKLTFAPDMLRNKMLIINSLKERHCELKNGFCGGVKQSIRSITIKITKEAQDALIANGKNIIAIHCTQKQGGQYIDAGIAVVERK